MNLQSLVIVILRLMALNFGLRATIQLTPWFMQSANAYRQFSSGESPAWLVVPWMAIILLLIGAVLIWIYAPAIARAVTKGVPQDVSFSNLSLVDCYSIAFLGAGLFYIAGHLPQVLNWIHYFLKRTDRDEMLGRSIGYEVSLAFIPFIFGMLLFLNGRKWAVLLAGRQTAVPTPAIPGETDSPQ